MRDDFVAVSRKITVPGAHDVASWVAQPHSFRRHFGHSRSSAEEIDSIALLRTQCAQVLDKFDTRNPFLNGCSIAPRCPKNAFAVRSYKVSELQNMAELRIRLGRYDAARISSDNHPRNPLLNKTVEKIEYTVKVQPINRYPKNGNSIRCLTDRFCTHNQYLVYPS